VVINPSTTNSNKPFLSNKIEQISSILSIPNALKKNLLWQIDYFSVPYYVRTYGNQLFVCDKYGLTIQFHLT
jgi:hypothetical protein